MSFREKILLFVLAGVGTVAGFYISGVIDLVGSTTQIPYVLAGVILGGILFSLMSVTFMPRIKSSVAAGSLLGAILIVADAIYVSTLPLASGLVVALCSLASCALLLPVFPVVGGKPRLSSVIFMIFGSILILAASAGYYIQSGYSGLGTIVDANFGAGIIVILVLIFVPNVRRNKSGLTSTKVLTSSIVIFILFASVIAAPNQIHAQNVTPIKHVVEIMMENHSFDNVFGTYPGTPNPLGIEVPLNLLKGDDLPQLKAVPNGTFSTADPVEGYIAYHEDWNGGTMSGFLKGSGSVSMLYYTDSQLGEEWSLAEQYAIGDMYFASQLSETSPNRLYSLAGYSPVINDYGPPPFVPIQQSIFSELSHYGVSWGYYIENPSKGLGTLNYFYGINQYLNHVQSWGDFFTELSNGTLPDVSWMMPVDGGAKGYSQGPPLNVLQGELWLMYVIDQIEKSPEWNSTAIFVTYDEGGGFYDQVPPPTLSGVQLGERVPLIVISPYAKEDYVSNTVMTHTSILAFIDYNWGLPALNNLVSQSNLPVDMFDFNQNYEGGFLARPPIYFNGFPMPNSYVFSLSEFSNLTTLSYLFPMKPQIPFNQLPYSREGSSSESLGISSGVYTTKDSGYVPLYQSVYFVGLVYALLLGLCLIGLRVRKPKVDS